MRDQRFQVELTRSDQLKRGLPALPTATEAELAQLAHPNWAYRNDSSLSVNFHRINDKVSISERDLRNGNFKEPLDELRIKVKAISHSLRQISPKILPNIDSYFICSLRGDNLKLAQQILGVTHEQAELLRVNPLGTACALVPSVWPLPVMITFPPLPESFE